jgi:cupin
MSTRIDGSSKNAVSDCMTRWSRTRARPKWFAMLLVPLVVAFSACATVGADTKMVMLQPDALQWGDPVLPGSSIPAFEKGAKVAVLQGVPGQGGPVVVRLKFPANFVIAPHWHTTDEIITVLAGTLHAGMGDQLDREKSLAFPTGAFVVMPAKHHHFAWTQEETMVEIHANNPFDIVYVNPADDPRKR